MTQQIWHFKEVVTELRQMLPADAAAAQAIDQHEPWEQIAMKAVDDGYIDSGDEFVRFVEACLE